MIYFFSILALLVLLNIVLMRFSAKEVEKF